MKQLDLLKNLIRETLDEMAVDEMARISVGYKLTDNYEEALAKLPANVQASTRTTRVINFLKDNPGAPKTEISSGGGFGGDQQAVNQIVNGLEMAGVVEKTGFTKDKAVKAPVGTGERGRPKVYDDEMRSKMTMGATLAKKFVKGDTNYTPEEAAYITDLYNSLNK